jgi:hypothetical protein
MDKIFEQQANQLAELENRGRLHDGNSVEKNTAAANKLKN